MSNTSKPNTFFISDLHIGHKNVIRFDNRPFDSVETMESEIIKRWNSVVSKNDNIYILGDMFWCSNESAIEILKKLNGNKFLIIGNHDRIHSKEFKDCFVKMSYYERIQNVDNTGKDVVMCHYPLSFWDKQRYGMILLYGHVHNSVEEDIFQEHLKNLTYTSKAINVGCMMPYMDYTPRKLSEII